MSRHELETSFGGVYRGGGELVGVADFALAEPALLFLSPGRHQGGGCLELADEHERSADGEVKCVLQGGEGAEQSCP
ncbi:hypothetical protein ACGFIY_33435 [Micromonospora chersina]|uniref:hypothetical protein n=1 Tax=Micromonospora chersina TaxID=47854 RepID=UPI00371C5206